MLFEQIFDKKNIHILNLLLFCLRDKFDDGADHFFQWYTTMLEGISEEIIEISKIIWI